MKKLRPPTLKLGKRSNSVAKGKGICFTASGNSSSGHKNKSNSLKKYKNHFKTISKDSSPCGNKSYKTLSHTINASPHNTLSTENNIKQIIENAQKLLMNQNVLIKKCNTLTSTLSKSDLDIDSMAMDFNINDIEKMIKKIKAKKMKPFNTITPTSNINSNTIPSSEDNNIKCKKCEETKTFFMTKLNSLNEFIGNLGLNYVFHKFKDHNFIFDNISVYFTNITKLINELNTQMNNGYKIIQTQNNKITELEQKMISYEKELEKQRNEMNKYNLFSNNSLNSNLFCSKSNQTFTFTKDNDKNNNPQNNQPQFNMNSKELFTLTKDFENEEKIKKETHFLDYQKNKEIKEESNNDLVNYSQRDNLNEQYNPNINKNEGNIPNLGVLDYGQRNNISNSNLFDSNSFFEGYKRNKDLKNDLDLNHHYGDTSMSKSFHH